MEAEREKVEALSKVRAAASAREARETEAREVNNKTRRRPSLTPRRTRVAPENLNTNKSQNRSQTIIQRLGSLFTRKSRKVAPEPVIGGIKTKFKRKRRRRISRNRLFFQDKNPYNTSYL